MVGIVDDDAIDLVRRLDDESERLDTGEGVHAEGTITALAARPVKRCTPVAGRQWNAQRERAVDGTSPVDGDLRHLPWS